MSAAFHQPLSTLIPIRPDPPKKRRQASMRLTADQCRLLFRKLEDLTAPEDNRKFLPIGGYCWICGKIRPCKSHTESI